MVKKEAFKQLDLLKKVVAFKMKFYPRGWARYSEAIPSFAPVPYSCKELYMTGMSDSKHPNHRHHIVNHLLRGLLLASINPFFCNVVNQPYFPDCQIFIPNRPA